MKKPVEELTKGDHIAGYHPKMTVDHIYKYHHILDNSVDIVVVFNTGGKAFYKPGNVVEVDEEGE